MDGLLMMNASDWTPRSDAHLTAMLHKLRAQEFELFASQTRCLRAMDLAREMIANEPRLDVDDPNDKTKKVKDQRYVEVLAIFEKAIDAAVRTGMP